MNVMGLTPEQRRAVETVGRSLLVSAAAGAGKTSVLAERCAHLVCDAQPKDQCDIDELLVVTFTDAAAAEMRERIAQTLRAKARTSPKDVRLNRQAALVESAHISTIHSFCAWVVRRWFSDAEVDPGAAVIDADEAALLRSEVLESLFAGYYAAQKEAGGLLGRVHEEAEEEKQDTRESKLDEAVAEAFDRLINDYGLGDDRAIGEVVLKLSEFVNSLPDPDGWLSRAYESIARHPRLVLLAHLADMRRELAWQREHCLALAASLADRDPACHFHIQQIRSYAEKVDEWLGCTPEVNADAVEPVVDVDAALAAFDAACRQIAGYKWDGRAPSVRDPSSAEDRQRAAEAKKKVKETLFEQRLRRKFCLFTTQEWLEGLERIAPYVRAVVDLARAFRRAYAQEKRRMAVLDFSDLERFAFDVLHDPTDPSGSVPSAIARAVQRKFAYVLVDEFQDINPIQERIIRLVSRETDPKAPDNLFAVGDVKQSIYRFRLAEPAIFSGRLEAFRSENGPGEAVFLQKNFRSRREILDTANTVFRVLMRRELGDIVYDEAAELRPGREFSDDSAPAPAELHVLERRWDDIAIESDEIERGVPERFNPARWRPIECEAYLIATRLRSLMASGEVKPEGRSLCYRDCAVLLRTIKVNAEQVASMLTFMGVPAYAAAGGSLFGALEVRDVLAVLQVLDNTQQDIPLAAVLRGGVMGDPLSEDELATIRCVDRRIPFHAAVRQYAQRRKRDDLHDRLRAVLDRMERYREAARHRPVAEVLWRIYEESGHLAYVSGLPNGAQRRANLLKLHEHARKFGTFRRQGLHRFLRFIESLQESGHDVASAPAIGEAEDVVRVMSVHQSKGLEFPVVFVAGLGTKFNLGDRAGRIIFERESGIGLRAVDTERLIEYPTCAHLRVAGEVERQTRAEEMRILYVAMTRARDKLILVGTAEKASLVWDQAGPACMSPTLHQIATANTFLDWLAPSLASAPAGVVCWPGEESDGKHTISVHIHEPDEMAGWTIGAPGEAFQRPGAGDDRQELTEAVTTFAPLPEHEPRTPSDPEVEEVVSRLEYTYPTLASASVRAVVGASEFKGTYDFTSDPDTREPGAIGIDPFEIPPSRYVEEEPMTPARRGTITHRVLQHLDFAAAAAPSGMASELLRLVEEGNLTEAEAAAVDRDALVWFAGTDLAGAIRQAGDRYRREFSYIANEQPTLFDVSIGPLGDEAVLVRGIVDGILPVEGGLDIIDFKTDVVGPEELSARVEHYTPQMRLYARAVQRIFQRPVTACRLVFLAARQIVSVNVDAG